MREYILKSNPLAEDYIVWSFVRDRPMAYGAFEDLRKDPENEFTVERKTQVDKTGTSAMDGSYGWDDTARLEIRGHGTRSDRNTYTFLPRAALEPFMDELWDNENGDQGEEEILLRYCEELPVPTPV